MAFLAKLNITVLVLIILSSCCSWCTSASSLHPRERENSRWISDCQIGSRKLGYLNCKNAEDSNMRKTPWSVSLKTALSPPPAPVKRVASRLGNVAPPPPNI